MAELLKRNTGPHDLSTSFWAVDKVIFAYLTFTGLLILGWWREVPEAPVFFSLHVVGVALMVYEVKRPNRTSWVFRNWYPLLYVASCYKEMAILIPPIRRTDSDQWLANLDFRIWHANPTVWLERIYSPGLTEYLQVVYTLFVPAVLFVAYLLWKSGKYPEFQYYAFLIALGLSGFLYRVPDRTGPGAALPVKILTAHSVARLMGLQRDAARSGPSGVGPLRLLSQWAHRAHHPGMVGESNDIEAAVQGLFCLHSVHHFCYSLSSIPLYGRRNGGSLRGDCFDPG